MSVYTWGRNSHGELGVNEAGNVSSVVSESSPKIVNDLMAISIAAGDGHSLFATESGDVYCCGRGKQGQLGLRSRDNVSTPQLITDLSHESVVRVAASGVSSYAITATGRVYQWGLVHLPERSSSSYYEETKGGASTSSSLQDTYVQVTAGQLTGLAADNQGKDIVIPVDYEARQHRGRNSRGPDFSSRRLKDIVTDSTERWMLANDDADEEYYRELESMGYDKEEVEQKMQNRGKEYHGMLQLACKRYILPTPQIISSLSHVKVVSLSAGFAHCLVLTDQGVMYSCGYNDRGQLGLGHRISSSEFRVVDYMQGKIVLQVECGQQHSMCRAIDRVRGGSVSIESINSSADKIGASVYVWGNGMLGQLGLGLKGTSKGRLLPTLLTTFCDVAPLGAIDISAGGNFSVAISFDGTVYSWGHAEYNQHGSAMTGGNDYVDNFFYFVPRPMIILDSNGAAEKFSYVSCGSNFTIALTEDGDAFSWGWNSYGVLGHGKGFYGQRALKIASLGQSQIDRTVVQVCAGSNHVLAVTSSSGCSWAKTFQNLLPQAVTVTATQDSQARHSWGLPSSTFADVEIVDEATGTIFPCHQVILAARSPYFAGYLKTAARIKKESTYNGMYHGAVEQIFLDCPAASVSTIHYLLQYIYTDTLSAPTHKRKQLAELAEFVAIHRLASLCWLHGSGIDRTAFAIQSSSFENDLLKIFGSDTFSDCKFILHSSPSEEYGSEEEYGNIPSPTVISGHKALFGKMPYFSSLFSGAFSDGYIDESGASVYDMAGFLSDGIDKDSFQRLVKFAYTGSKLVLEVEDSNQLMCLLLASNRVGLTQLTQLCEKKLSLHLNDYPENIENCLTFAQMYNIPRLCRQCEELIKL